MSAYRSSGRTTGVREPVQVYLDADDRTRLERLTAELDTSKSDVLRRGLAALERQLDDPAEHPLLSVIGVAGPPAAEGEEPGYDVAREHDRFLADADEASWPPRDAEGASQSPCGADGDRAG